MPPSQSHRPNPYPRPPPAPCRHSTPSSIILATHPGHPGRSRHPGARAGINPYPCRPPCSGLLIGYSINARG